jgi:hypothetical protein
MNNTVRIIVGAIISAGGFLYALFATFMLLWGWSDSGRPWSAGEWTFAVILWSPPFLFSLWLVYRCTGSRLKLTALSELVGIVGVSLWLAAVFIFGGEPQTLLERQTPLVEVTYLTNRVPNLPLRYPAVGTEMPDGKFSPIMFLTHESGRLGTGYKEFSMIGPKFDSPKIKVYRGTNDSAADNCFLGEFEIVNYSKTQKARELWLFFSVNEKRQLFVQARAIDKTHNDALKLKRVSK